MESVIEIKNPAVFYEGLYKEKADADTPWIKSWREEVYSHFGKTGFPTVDDEIWRLNPLSLITDLPFYPAKTSTNNVLFEHLKPCFYAFDPEIKLVFLNGRFAPQFSSVPSIEGVEIRSLSQAILEGEFLERDLTQFPPVWGNSFVDLNTLLFVDGTYLKIRKSTVLGLPIHLYYFSISQKEVRSASYPRSLILLERGCQAKVVESFIELGSAEHWSNGVTQIRVGEDSALEYGRIHHGRQGSCSLGSIYSLVQRGSRFNSHAVTLGGKFVRNDLKVVLEEEGAECNLNGLYIGMGEEFVDHHTVIEHGRSHTLSRELYKGILDGRSRAVFNGSIIVGKGAQKTDALQNNKNLLLSDKARIFTKPQLEIFANDVKCKHGATIGQLDSDLLFYLRSRGILKEEARKILILAFASEIIDKITMSSLREALTKLLFSRLMEAKHES